MAGNYKICLGVTERDSSFASETLQGLVTKSHLPATIQVFGSRLVLAPIREDCVADEVVKFIETDAIGSPDDLFREARRCFPESDLILVRPGLFFPAEWDIRLQAAAYRRSGIAT